MGDVVDSADFYVGEQELSHLHLSGDVHLASSPALGQTLVAGGWARPMRLREGLVGTIKLGRPLLEHFV